jgi:hypothetical protein
VRRVSEVLRIHVTTGAAGEAEQPRLVVPLDDDSRIATLARGLLELYPDATRIVVERAEGNPTAAS